MWPSPLPDSSSNFLLFVFLLDFNPLVDHEAGGRCGLNIFYFLFYFIWLDFSSPNGSPWAVKDLFFVV